MLLKDSQRFMNQAAGKESVQTAVAGIFIAALAGAAAGFCLAVKLGKRKKEIRDGCRPAIRNSDRTAADASGEAGNPEKQGTAQPSNEEKAKTQTEQLQ